MKTTKIVMIKLFQCAQVTLIELHDMSPWRKQRWQKTKKINANFKGIIDAIDNDMPINIVARQWKIPSSSFQNIHYFGNTTNHNVGATIVLINDE
jgi:hypothetical protein